jgi:hypothetical protein
MAILQLEEDMNEKIHYVSDIIIDINTLMAEGPKRLTSYENLLHMLKSIKRGIPKTEIVRKYCLECCPPGMESDEQCNIRTCAGCWLMYINDLDERIKEKEEK